ncbi:metallophosphoesterase [Terrihabitans soli]|uniref:Metallophosphoesterase n=1 Tax=Terrihabitans soli TaxID=708113 RepID=A0A6S6QRH6_9HYPH|nr:TIGR00282 family metallophosphoesterase [Terrihabitans soli]BCJ89872.1 metallophosphoesterase [Terrihabitans soli]
MRILFLGDLVGRAGRQVAIDQIPRLRTKWKIDLLVVNGENAAGGFGINEDIYESLIEVGADAVTLGNHAFDQRETLVFIERAERLVRPANYPPGTPGRGSVLVELHDGRHALVMNLMGRTYMDAMDDPFALAERELAACPLRHRADAILIDFHGEATSEKQAFGHFVDGRASVVVGTHTHVPTADQQIFAGGTAYISDAGMCGDYDSILGMDKEEPIRRFTRKIPSGRFEPATGEATLCGLAVETDDATGLAMRISRVCIGPRLESCLPKFW